MDDNKAKFEAWFMEEFPMESLITDQNGNYKYEHAIAAWAAWNASHKKRYTNFLIVESIWPEGFRVHGIFTTLQGAVDSVPKCDIWRKGDALIEEVPFDAPLTVANADHQGYIASRVASYELDGTKLT